MKKQWQMRRPDSQTVHFLARQIGCSPLIARLLVIRGIQTKNQADRFLAPSFSHLTPPMEMADMAKAVRRIHRAIASGEQILVFGDYDADGITATALLVAFLRHCGARVDYAIPHRIADGYGLGTDFITKRAKPGGVDLIITVDCGSGSDEAVRLARRIGIDTIITDHHPIDRLPQEAVAVVNPARRDCGSHLTHLAGVGVAFYLVIALRTHLRKAGYWRLRKEPNLKRLCDLVAIGTIADVTPLTAENRALTAAGLEQINTGNRPGIGALMRRSGLLDAPVDAEAVAFRLAPRLNAAGRLVHAKMACELLLTDDPIKADRLSAVLCRLNNRRQAMESDLLQSILDDLNQAPEQLESPVLVVHGHRWHEGILGIVASRLTQRFSRPTVVISSFNGQAKGSARSVDSVDLAALLNQCADLLDRFGGHPMAAGLSLQASRIESLKTRLAKLVGQLPYTPGTDATLAIDAELSLADVTPQLMDHIDRLGPFGQGNPQPLFLASDIRVNRCQTVGERHRRMLLSGEAGNGSYPAIQFNVSGAAKPIDRLEEIVYRPQWNYWNGRKKLQLVIEDTNDCP